MFTRLINAPSSKSFFLLGPRGTGKTTWVRSKFPEAVFVDLLESEIFNDLLASPQRLEKMISPGHQDWIVIDEIQRVPELLNEVHRLIEKKGHRFILTGSSARKIRSKGVNLLAGRALTEHLFPLTVAELGSQFDLKQSLAHGHLPSVFSESDPKRYLESYLETYLKEEVLYEGLTRNLSAFSRFMETASLSQGQVLNISSVARDAGVERKAVANYFSILEDLLIGYRIPVFTQKSKRRLISHSKFYFFDAGVYRAIRPMGPLDAPEEAQGHALETLFLQELMAINAYLRLGYKIYYWQTSNGMEVDFVLYGEKGIIAFEIKRAGKISGSMTRGLRAFLADYPNAKAYLIYGGEKRQWEGAIQAVPMADALHDLRTILN